MFRRLEFRQTMGQRAFNGALVGVGIGILMTRISFEQNPGFWIAVSVSVLLFGLYVWRMVGLSVMADGDDLVVRNLWRTSRLPRWGIEEFRVVGIYRPPFRTVKVVRRSGGALEVDVFLSCGLTPTRRRRRADAVSRLNEWLDAAT